MTRLHFPVEVLAASFYHAVNLGLPNISEELTDHESLYQMPTEARRQLIRDAQAGSAALPARTVTRRPQSSECLLLAMFPQLWGSTALGFGGLGGAAMTRAYTTVIQGPGGDICVYFDGRHAYTLLATAISTEQKCKFDQDISRAVLESVRKAEIAYGAVPSRPIKSGCL